MAEKRQRQNSKDVSEEPRSIDVLMMSKVSKSNSSKRSQVSLGDDLSDSATLLGSAETAQTVASPGDCDI